MRGVSVSRFYKRLYDGKHRLELSAEHPFEPHMTIASYDVRADVEKIDVSAIGDFPIKATVSALELVQLDQGRLTTLKTVRLHE